MRENWCVRLVKVSTLSYHPALKCCDLVAHGVKDSCVRCLFLYYRAKARATPVPSPTRVTSPDVADRQQVFRGLYGGGAAAIRRTIGVHLTLFPLSVAQLVTPLPQLTPADRHTCPPGECFSCVLFAAGR